MCHQHKSINTRTRFKKVKVMKEMVNQKKFKRKRKNMTSLLKNHLKKKTKIMQSEKKKKQRKGLRWNMLLLTNRDITSLDQVKLLQISTRLLVLQAKESFLQ